MKITISKSQWLEMGKKAGWMRTADTRIEQIDPKDLGGAAWDMMGTGFERALHMDNWQTYQIPNLLYEANGIWHEVDKDISTDYMMEKLQSIKRWADRMASIDPARFQQDAKIVAITKKSLLSMTPKSAQQMAIKRIMEAALDLNTQAIMKNLDYLNKWINSFGAKDMPETNVGAEPIY